MQAAERAEKCRFFGDLDLWPWPSNSSERGTKHMFRANLVQIHSAVLEVFHTQTKKHRLMVPKNRTFRSSTRANPVWILGLLNLRNDSFPLFSPLSSTNTQSPSLSSPSKYPSVATTVDSWLTVPAVVLQPARWHVCPRPAAVVWTASWVEVPPSARPGNRPSPAVW